MLAGVRGAASSAYVWPGCRVTSIQPGRWRLEHDLLSECDVQLVSGTWLVARQRAGCRQMHKEASRGVAFAEAVESVKPTMNESYREVYTWANISLSCGRRFD